MGQKVHPKIFRIKINKTWDSKWFADSQDFSMYLKQDVQIRRFILKKFKEAGVAKVEIERSANTIAINISASKPGLIIGRGGKGAEDLKKEIHNKFLKDAFSRKKGIKNININIFEIDRPALKAAIVAQQVIADLEKRIPFRRTVKQAVGRVERAGARGVKIIVAGRLNGAEIARSETFFSGKIPLHTLRADIDYSRGTANTIYGTIGVKVWIYCGEIFQSNETVKNQTAASEPLMIKK